MTMNLFFDVITAHMYHGITKHSQKVMSELGITYTHSTPQSISDVWWFWNCENVPEKLPSYLSVLKRTPHECIGWGVSKEEADDIVARSKKMTGFDSKRDAATDKLQEPVANRPLPWQDQLLKAHPKSDPEFWPDTLQTKYMAKEIAEYRALAQPVQPVQKPNCPITGWKVEVRGSNQRLFVSVIYGDTVFVDLPEAQPEQTNFKLQNSTTITQTGVDKNLNQLFAPLPMQAPHMDKQIIKEALLEAIETFGRKEFALMLVQPEESAQELNNGS